MKQELGRISTNFSRGLNSKVTSHLIDKEEVSVSENFLYDEGSPYVREGSKLYNQNTNLSAPVVMMQKIYNRDLSSYYTAIAGGKLFAANLSGTFVQVSSQPISGHVSQTTFNEEMIFTTQSGQMLAFNGSSVRIIGISSPVHKVQIADFETDEVWTTGIADTTYMRVDEGKRAWRINTSGPNVATTSGKVRADLSTSFNLTKFGSISSVDQDLIKLFVSPATKANISTIDLIFDCKDGTFGNYSTQCYWARITNISSYVSSLSNEGWGATYVMPKSSFSAPVSTVYSWSSVVGIRLELAQTSKPAICTFDNLRMEKTPPTITIASSYYGLDTVYSKFFWGSAKVLIKALVEMVIPIPENSDIQIQDVQTSGLMSGRTYYYKATYVKRGHNDIEIESNPTFQTSGITPAGNASTHHAVYIANIPVSDNNQVTARKLYRRKSTDTTYQHLYTILDNTTENFVDDIPDALLGHTLDEGHNPPPKARYILKANNQKIYVFNVSEFGKVYPSRVRWSMPYENEYWPLGNGKDVAPEDGSIGTGMFEYFNLIHLLKETSTWMLDENNSLRNIHKKIGCIAPDSLAQSEDAEYWLSDGAVIEYKLRFRKISQIKGGANIKDIIARLPKTYLGNAQGVFFDGFYLLAVTDSGSTINNLVLCWDSVNEIWTTFPDLEVRSWTVTEGGLDPYALFFGNYSGQVFEMFNGNYDYSSHIASKIRSKDFGIPSPETSFRKGYIQTNALDGQERTLLLQPYIDFNAISETMLLYAGSGYNTAVSSKFVLPQQTYGNFCSIEISSSGRYRISQMDLYGKEQESR